MFSVLLKKIQLPRFTTHWTLSLLQLLMANSFFLDTLVSQFGNGNLDISVYKKPTHTDRYLDFNSHQENKQKISTTNAFLHRALNFPNSESGKPLKLTTFRPLFALMVTQRKLFQRSSIRNLQLMPLLILFLHLKTSFVCFFNGRSAEQQQFRCSPVYGYWTSLKNSQTTWYLSLH